ncbi:MAG TPA: hypothetical protein VMX36_00935 [Sedimentisphaerales bacterium]|nr:hypothetical protein [Sedimentisphaerales bacterium]
MNEKKKIDEADYFLSQMHRTQNIPDNFDYNLSAFLSAGRTVCQYAQKESTNKPGGGGQNWYDTQINSSPVLSFFRDERDFNIHQEPVNPKKDINVVIDNYIGTSLSVTVLDNNLKEKNHLDLENKAPLKKDNISVTYRYYFHKWQGSEDVLSLCKKYLDELKLFVQKGIAQGFLSVT